VEQGYGFIKLLDRVTEDMPEPEYYELLEKTLEALNRSTVPLKLVTIWFWAQLLKLAGHTPNLKLDYTGNNLETTKVYFFDFETMHFTSNEQGKFSASDIKFLRLLFDRHNPDVLSRIQNLDGLLSDSLPLVETMLKTHIRI
jgi:recombinational DNA repair protein (RecF pathway)